VTNIPWLGPFGRQGGFTAWLLWLGIHIAYLIGFSNRLVVLVRWAGSFLTHGRGTRLITGSQLLPPIEEPEPPVIADAEEEEAGPAGASTTPKRKVTRTESAVAESAPRPAPIESKR
jgi:hypothetical protein